MLEPLFGGDTPSGSLDLYQIAARAVAVYIIGVVIVRLGKSRLVGRVSALDILVGFILGSLLSRGITGHASLSGTAMGSAGVVATHWLFTWLAAHWHAFGNLTKGHAVQLVSDGLPLPANMSASHISKHDLIEAARLRGIATIGDIAEAYKERNGEISIIKQRER
jgi:uncharacterized membrane protein YcaP (DUF421 family)